MAASINEKKQSMSISNTEQFKKDWITTLVSTSGVMLTLSLMILTILYTATSISIYEWKKMLITAPIVVASFFLALSIVHSLRTLGTLINTSAHQEKENMEEAGRVGNKTAEKAIKAEQSFKRGLWCLIIAITLCFIFFNWSFFICMFIK